jgi:hypothetical protein
MKERIILGNTIQLDGQDEYGHKATLTNVFAIVKSLKHENKSFGMESVSRTRTRFMISKARNKGGQAWALPGDTNE